MKEKFISIATIVLMVCSVMSFTSCGDKEEDATNKVTCTGSYAAYARDGLTDGEWLLINLSIDVINARANQLLGSSYELEVDANGKLTTDAYNKVAKVLNNDAEIQAGIETLYRLKNDAGKYLVYGCEYTIVNGNKDELGYVNSKNSNYEE